MASMLFLQPQPRMSPGPALACCQPGGARQDLLNRLACTPSTCGGSTLPVVTRIAVPVCAAGITTARSSGTRANAPLVTASVSMRSNGAAAQLRLGAVTGAARCKRECRSDGQRASVDGWGGVRRYSTATVPGHSRDACRAGARSVVQGEARVHEVQERRGSEGQRQWSDSLHGERPEGLRVHGHKEEEQRHHTQQQQQRQQQQQQREFERRGGRAAAGSEAAGRHRAEVDEREALSVGLQRKRSVVLWDLDNVQPSDRMPPRDAALRLRDVAAAFGRAVDILAYANR